MFHMHRILKLVLLFYFAALKETKCTAMENSKLTFTFPVNINSTQTDFSIYFYPDSGGEGKLFLQMFRLCVNTEHVCACVCTKEGKKKKSPF